MNRVLEILRYIGTAGLAIASAIAQSVTVTSVNDAAVEVYDMWNSTRLASACLPSGPIPLPSVIRAQSTQGAFASLQLFEDVGSAASGLVLVERSGTVLNAGILHFGSASGCAPVVTGPHELVIEFENPGALELSGKFEIELAYPVPQVGFVGRVFVDVNADGSRELSVAMTYPPNVGVIRREVAYTIPARTKRPVRYVADLIIDHPWSYYFIVKVTFVAQRGVIAKSYGASCGPRLNLARVPAERNTAILQGSSFTANLPAAIALGVQAQDVLLGPGTCRLLLVPMTVLPMGLTSSSGNVEVMLTAPFQVLGLRAQMFAWSALTNTIESSTGLLLNVIP